jgi:hypothetical protein
MLILVGYVKKLKRQLTLRLIGLKLIGLSGLLLIRGGLIFFGLDVVAT